jgi:hypothetical protein
MIKNGGRVAKAGPPEEVAAILVARLKRMGVTVPPALGGVGALPHGGAQEWMQGGGQ